MFVLQGIIQLIWDVLTLPFHLLFSLIKFFIIGPILLLITLAVLLVACVALALPATLPAMPRPPFITAITSWLSHPALHFPSTLSADMSVTPPSTVTCIIRGRSIVVRWTGQTSGAAQWYQVLRRSLEDSDWHRIALVTARDHAPQYEYADTAVQHGFTYRYGVVALGADGEESEIIASSLQMVAP